MEERYTTMSAGEMVLFHSDFLSTRETTLLQILCAFLLSEPFLISESPSPMLSVSLMLMEKIRSRHIFIKYLTDEHSSLMNLPKYSAQKRCHQNRWVINKLAIGVTHCLFIQGYCESAQSTHMFIVRDRLWYLI